MRKISKVELARNLDRAIDAEVGQRGLNILIAGWMEYHHYGSKYREAIYHRKWLYITEALELSHYAGYDLTFYEF